MRQDDLYINKIDWLTISIYALLVIFGWFNIYAAVYDEQAAKSIFDFSINSGKHDEENSRNLTLHGVDVNWVTEDWQIMGEYTKSIIKNPEDYLHGESEGYFVQVVIYMGSFQPFASYQKLRYLDPYHGPGFSPELGAGEGIDVDRSRWALGAVYIPVPNVFLSFEYDFNREKPLDLKDDMWTIRAAVSF